MSTPTQDIEHLWPTALLRRTLPNADAANRVLGALILESDTQRENLTTDYLSGNFFALEHPVAMWLRECVQKSAVDYLRHQGVDYEVRMALHGWANVNRLGDYHDLHNHPHSYLSGTYYVAVPDGPARAGTRNDLSPGAISFYDPRPQANMTAIRGDMQVEAEHTVTPHAGLIMMWPAFLRHFVHPNLSDEPRISISFNVVLQGMDDYLPKQK